MTLTDAATRELAAQDCATSWLVLLEIGHPQLPAPLRVTSDGVATISNGVSYEPFRFEVTLPDDAEGRAPICRSQGLDCHEEQVREADLEGYDGAFLCSTLMEIQPITKLADRQLSTCVDPRYQAIISKFKRLTRG